MKLLRQIVIWGTPTAVALLAALSVLGAFLGAEDAKELFNSPPVVVYWVLLAALFVAGLFGFRSLLKRPGLLAMHLGSLLILGGSMWASRDAHAFARVYLKSNKIPSAMMLIHQGETTDQLLGGENDEPIGKLPFALKLNRFWIEYYPQEDRPWRLAVGTLRHMKGQEERELSWKVGSELALPDTGNRVKVLQYLPSARPVTDAARKVVGAEAAPGEERPGMEVLVRSDGEEQHAWLVPEPKATTAELPLALPRPSDEARETGVFVMAQSLFFYRPTPPIRAYKSDLALLKDGEEVARKTILVNDPLHFGGYHFYQADYDTEHMQYTVLQVKSDNGLTAVYAGFILAVAGGFWWFWVTPVWQRLSSRSGHGA